MGQCKKAIYSAAGTQFFCTLEEGHEGDHRMLVGDIDLAIERDDPCIFCGGDMKDCCRYNLTPYTVKQVVEELEKCEAELDAANAAMEHEELAMARNGRLNVAGLVGEIIAAKDQAQATAAARDKEIEGLREALGEIAEQTWDNHAEAIDVVNIMKKIAEAALTPTPE